MRVRVTGGLQRFRERTLLGKVLRHETGNFLTLRGWAKGPPSLLSYIEKSSAHTTGKEQQLNTSVFN